MLETWVWSLGWKDPLEKGKATSSSILAWRIPWTEEPGGLQSMRSQRVGHGWATFTHSSCILFCWNFWVNFLLLLYERRILGASDCQWLTSPDLLSFISTLLLHVFCLSHILCFSLDLPLFELITIFIIFFYCWVYTFFILLEVILEITIDT